MKIFVTVIFLIHEIIIADKTKLMALYSTPYDFLRKWAFRNNMCLH
jgi:hypothetical protein